MIAGFDRELVVRPAKRHALGARVRFEVAERLDAFGTDALDRETVVEKQRQKAVEAHVEAQIFALERQVEALLQ